MPLHLTKFPTVLALPDPVAEPLLYPIGFPVLFEGTLYTVQDVEGTPTFVATGGAGGGGGGVSYPEFFYYLYGDNRVWDGQDFYSPIQVFINDVATNLYVDPAGTQADKYMVAFQGASETLSSGTVYTLPSPGLSSQGPEKIQVVFTFDVPVGSPPLTAAFTYRFYTGSAPSNFDLSLNGVSQAASVNIATGNVPIQLPLIEGINTISLTVEVTSGSTNQAGGRFTINDFVIAEVVDYLTPTLVTYDNRFYVAGVATLPQRFMVQPFEEFIAGEAQVALGTGAIVRGGYGNIAVGERAVAGGDETLVVGQFAVASPAGAYSLLMGHYAETEVQESTVIGQSTTADQTQGAGFGAMVIGAYSYTRFGTGHVIGYAVEALEPDAITLGGYEKIIVQGDPVAVESNQPGAGHVLVSPNGTKWLVTVDDAGILTTALYNPAP